MPKYCHSQQFTPNGYLVLLPSYHLILDHSVVAPAIVLGVWECDLHHRPVLSTLSRTLHPTTEPYLKRTTCKSLPHSCPRMHLPPGAGAGVRTDPRCCIQELPGDFPGLVLPHPGPGARGLACRTVPGISRWWTRYPDLPLSTFSSTSSPSCISPAPETVHQFNGSTWEKHSTRFCVLDLSTFVSSIFPSVL